MIVSNVNTTLSAAADSRNASSPWVAMNCWIRPSGSWISSITSAGSMFVPNVSFRKSTVWVTYPSELRSRSAI